MNEQNPYQAPDANVVIAKDTNGDALAVIGTKSLPISAGWTWLTEGFSLFTKSPLIWIVMFIIGFAINLASQFIPIIGPLAISLLYAVFFAGFLFGCVALDNNESLEVGHLFAGFSRQTSSLIGLGAAYLIITILFAIVFIAILFLTMGGMSIFENMAGLGNMSPDEIFTPGLLLLILSILALTIPFAMLFWFAPALVALGQESVVNSLKLSFIGCLKNILPFLLYGLIWLILAVIASLPFLLGWLVLAPVSIASIYVAYRDIYTSYL